MLFQVGCSKLLLVTEHLQPGRSGVPACGSLRLGCASASSISGSTAVTLVWPSSQRLFTCRGMQSYVSPNLSERTSPVPQTTGKRRNMALAASDSTCHHRTLIRRWLVSSRGPLHFHMLDTHPGHCPAGRLSSLPQLQLWKFRFISSFHFMFSIDVQMRSIILSQRVPLMEATHVPCWFAQWPATYGSYGNKENWHIHRER